MGKRKWGAGLYFPQYQWRGRGGNPARRRQLSRSLVPTKVSHSGGTAGTNRVDATATYWQRRGRGGDRRGRSSMGMARRRPRRCFRRWQGQRQGPRGRRRRGTGTDYRRFFFSRGRSLGEDKRATSRPRFSVTTRGATGAGGERLRLIRGSGQRPAPLRRGRGAKICATRRSPNVRAGCGSATVRG